MSLKTIVSKMIAANEPESNIAKVIKYHKKDNSKINCEKCDHSWKVSEGGNDLYMCHECGHNNNKSPLKAVGTCPDGSEPDEFGKCNEEKVTNEQTLQENITEEKIPENPVLTEKKKRFKKGKFLMSEKDQAKEFSETGTVTPTKKESEDYTQKLFEESEEGERLKLNSDNYFKDKDSFLISGGKPGEKNIDKFGQQSLNDLVSNDETIKKIVNDAQNDPNNLNLVNKKSEELKTKYDIKNSFNNIYTKVQKENESAINNFAAETYKKVGLGNLIDGTLYSLGATEGPQYDKRKKEADTLINKFIQDLAKDEIALDKNIQAYNSDINNFQNELLDNSLNLNEEYKNTIKQYQNQVQNNISRMASENETKIREVTTEQISNITGVPEMFISPSAAVGEFVLNSGAGVVDFVEKYGYAPLAALIKGDMYLDGEEGVAAQYDKVARQNNIDMSEVYDVAKSLGSLKTKYYDENGKQQDGRELLAAGRFSEAIEILLNDAVGSAPSLALSLAFPIAGSTLLGMATAGQGFEEDLVNRPKETIGKIAGANLLKGTFETGMEYAGAKLFNSIKLLKSFGGSKFNSKVIMGKLVGPYINATLKTITGGLGEFGTEFATNFGQEYTDAFVYGDEKEVESVFLRSVNAGMVGALLGGGASGVTSIATMPEQKQAIFESLAPSQWRQQKNEIDYNIVETKKELKNTNSKLKKKRLEEQVKVLELQKENKVKELNKIFEGLIKTGEITTVGKNNDIIAESNGIINNDNYTKKEQDQAIENRKKAAEQNRELITPEFYDQGIEDIITEELETADFIGNIENISGKGQNYLKSKGQKKGPDGKSYRRNVQYVNSPKEMESIGNKLGKNNWSESDAEYIFNTETQTVDIYVNTVRAAATGQLNALGHELFHDFVTLNFDRNDGKGVEPLVNSFKEYLKKANPDVYNRIETRINARYLKDGKLEKGASEEFLNIFTDIAAKEKIEIQNEETSLVKKLANSIERSLQGFGFGSVQLNDGKAVFDFLKNYSKNINKNRFKVLNVKATSNLVKPAVDSKKGFEAPSRSEINKAFVEESKSLKNALDTKQITQPEYDSKYKKAKDSFDNKIKNLVEDTDNKVEYSKLQELYENSLDENGKLIQTELGKNKFQLGINKIAAPIFESITKRLYDRTPKDLLDEYSRENFINDLRSASYEMIVGKEGSKEKFDPKVQNLDKYLSNRLNLRANRIIDQATGKDNRFTEDLTSSEAQAVSSDQQTNDKISLSKPIVKALNLQNLNQKSEKLIEGFLNNITISNDVKNKLKNPKISDKKKINLLRKSLGNLFTKQLKNEISKELGKNTKTSNEFSKYLDKNYDSLVDAALNNIDFQMGSGVSSSWSFDSVPTKQEFIDYYEGKDILPSQPRSVKADRKKSLVNAIAKQISNDALLDFAKTNPATAELFNKENNVNFASRSEVLYNLTQTDGKKFITNLESLPGWNPNSANPAAGVPAEILKKIGGPINFETVEGINRFFDILDKIDSKKLPKSIFTKTGLRPSPRMFGLKRGSSKARANDKSGKLTEEYKILNDLFEKRREKFLNQEFAEFVGDAKGWTLKDYNKEFGTTEKEIKKNWYKKDNFNKKNLSMFQQTWQSFYDIIETNPKFAAVVNHIAQTDMGASSWMRMGAELLAYSKNPKGVKGKNGKIKYYEWEHAMQANNVKLILLEGAIKGVKFNQIYPSVKNNFKLIALDKALDGVLGASGRKNSMGKNFNFITGSWTQRYFDPDVALYGGIDPNSMTTGEQTLGELYNIDEAGELPISFSSKSSNRTFYEDGDGVSQIESPLSREFNKMLEKTKGVKADAVYSDARAAKMGTKKGFQAFVPYSAEDFLGLIYPTLGKGEQGNKDLKWWKDNVMTPYNDGMTNFESAKQAAMIEWNQIKDQIQNTPTNLGKEAVRDFSNEDAIRVYLWDQKGVVPDGLSKKDISALTKHVKANPELQDFANQVAGLNINGYPDPTKGWLAGTITTDLVNHVNTTTRSEMLEPWQRAIDEIYTKDNKNKLRATYGDKYIEALDDILYRMKTGRNRPTGANRITNNWLNWVNDSVGTIMFFNQRSAILQTISSINFINWSDNNPIAAAKAFANQKQYWSDFAELFNSDFLKQRRSGLKTDVNSDEIAQQAAGSTNKVRAGLSLLLKKGFLPTQIADSFAIASGGSTFYRNRINSLMKEGMNEADAKKQAFSDFRDSANESQQSSDPSRISMEQASSLGRVILAFANTPIQYTRLTKRAVQDLMAGRGDWKTNVSKIVYYGAVQNIIFTALQQAMFGMLFADDDDEFQNERKGNATFNIANSTADTFLRGSGVAGAFVAMLKNMALEVKRQSEKSRSDYTKVADKLFTVSPPIDSKFRKLKSAGRAFTYKQELEKMRTRGVALDNPGLMAIAQTISAFGNIPADRVLRKLNNIVESTNDENAIWQRIALAMGWGQWELGIEDRKTREAKIDRDAFKRIEKSIGKVVKKREKDAKKKSPIKDLAPGVLGEANRDGSIVVAKGLSKKKREEVIKHEKVHQKEMKSGKLDYDDNFVYYGKKKYERKNGKIMHNGKAKIEGDHSLPWEKVAHNA